MYRDGLGVPVDKQKAYAHFQAAAGQDLAESQINMAKLHLGKILTQCLSPSLFT